jgi:hypothetical protein
MIHAQFYNEVLCSCFYVCQYAASPYMNTVEILFTFEFCSLNQRLVSVSLFWIRKSVRVANHSREVIVPILVEYTLFCIQNTFFMNF